MDLRMPISRVRSMTAVYMDWKMTRKPMTTAMPMTTAEADVEAGEAVGRDGGEVLVDGLRRCSVLMPGVARMALADVLLVFGRVSVRR